MNKSFGPRELALLQRIVDIAAADLGVDDDEMRSIMAARVVAAVERGDWDFELLMAQAKGQGRDIYVDEHAVDVHVGRRRKSGSIAVAPDELI